MFDPGIQLLLACVRTPGAVQGGQIQAEWHCVEPLLYWNLQAEAPDLVPSATLSTLRARFEDNCRRNLFWSGQLIRLTTKFRERKIPVIAYKGPVLCSYYQNLGLRQFDDLDFLVAPEDVARADEMLRQDGFRPHLYKPCAQEPRTLPFARAFHYEMVYTADSGTKVDLHWALMPGFWALTGHAVEIWTRLQTLSVGGGTVATLSHEDSLLLLCAHGTKHMWRSLGWICDVAAMLHAVPGLDWRTIEERAARLRVKRAVRLGLHLANDLLGATLPADVARTIGADPETQKLATAVKESLFARNFKTESVIENCSFLMRTRENVRDSIRCALEQIFQPTMAEWQSIALPRVLFPAYYFLRPVRLLTKHVFRG
jgi:hypothetical protein